MRQSLRWAGALGFLLFCGSNASAQSSGWGFSTGWTGNKSHHYHNDAAFPYTSQPTTDDRNETIGNSSNPYNSPSVQYPPSGYSMGALYFAYEASVNIEGNCVLVCKWYPSQAGQPVPPQVKVKLVPTASSSVECKANTSPQLGGNASNGFGDTVRPLDNWSYDPWSKQWTSSSVEPQKPLRGYIKTISTDGGEWKTDSSGRNYWEVRHAIGNMSASSSLSTGQWNYVGGRLSASLSLGAQEDLRSVHISSNIEPSMRKGPNSQPVLCESLADGAMEVHKVATKRIVTLSDGSQAKKWYGSGYFTAHSPYFVSPTYSWDVGSATNIANGKNLEVIDQAQFIPGGPWSLHLADGNLSEGKSTVFKVTVTDGNDGVVGVNTYTVNWHRPFENVKDDPNDSNFPQNGAKFWDTDVASCNVTAGSAINGTTGATVVIKKTFFGTLANWAEKGLDGLAIFDPRDQTASATLDFLVEAGILTEGEATGEVSYLKLENDSDMFTKAQELGRAPQDLAHNKCVLIKPLYYAQYKVRHLIGDAYGPNGYIGQEEKIAASYFDDSGAVLGEGWTGDYAVKTNSSSGAN